MYEALIPLHHHLVTDFQSVLSQEVDHAYHSVSQYPRNYYGWTYLIKLIASMPDSFVFSIGRGLKDRYLKKFSIISALLALISQIILLITIEKYVLFHSDGSPQNLYEAGLKSKTLNQEQKESLHQLFHDDYISIRASILAYFFFLFFSISRYQGNESLWFFLKDLLLLISFFVEFMFVSLICYNKQYKIDSKIDFLSDGEFIDQVKLNEPNFNLFKKIESYLQLSH